MPTMERRVAKKDLHAIVEQGRCQGRMSVRRKQFQLLDEGNVTMAILGKQMLGQRDSFSHRFVDGADRDRGAIRGFSAGRSDPRGRRTR